MQLTRLGDHRLMSDPQETFRSILERYRTGRYEASRTIDLLEGLYAQMDPKGKKWLLNSLWEELLDDFQKAIKGENVLNWIFGIPSVSLLNSSMPSW
jgi:hypothetical protein